MKTIKLYVFSILLTLALAGQAQPITTPGWYKAGNPRSLPAAGDGPVTPGFVAAGKAQTFSPLFSSLVIPTAPDIAEAVTPDIQALARGLENDPARIFEYVHDHIRHVLYYGSKKGAELTLLEQSGNDFDQCALLVALLDAAGYSNNVGYQFGVMKLPYDSPDHNDLHHWLSLNLMNTNWANTTNYLYNLLSLRGYPTNPVAVCFDEGNSNTIAFQHVVVKLGVGSTNYYLDPAFKDNEPVTGINLGSAMGFSSNSIISAVDTGATFNTNFVKLLNEAGLRSTMQGFNSNLLATIQSNYPNASVSQILGGWQIIPWTNALNQTAPVIDTRGGIYPTLTWTYEPTNFMSTFGIALWNVTNTWYYPQLQGGRVSLTFSSNGVAQLWLEDTLIFAKTNTGGTSVNVNLNLTHPYSGWNTNSNLPVDTGLYDASVPNSYICTNASYSIIYCFEPDVKWLNAAEQEMDEYRQQGYSNKSRQVLTEALQIMGLSWVTQNKLMEDIVDQQLGMLPEYIDRVGRMAEESGRGYYIDMYFQFDGLFPNTGVGTQDLSNDDQAFDMSAYIGSALEHAVIEQLQTNGLVAASTVKLLEIASTNGQAIYLANSNNWASVSNKFINYSFPQLNYFISQGCDILLPTNGSIKVAGTGSWTGTGYVLEAPGQSIGMLIGGGYSGGFISDPFASVDNYVPFIQSSIGFSAPTYANPTPVFTPPVFSADPVNMADATFRLDTTDLTLGKSEPMGLSLARYYTPTRQHLNLASMANGWIHSYYFNLAEVSDPQASLGLTTPAQMVPMLVTTYSLINFFDQNPDPRNWMTTALMAKWGVDQVISNAVSIEIGEKTLEFVKQPGGRFTPPANCTWTLTNSGTYHLQERQGNAFLFNAAKRLGSITNQSGQTLSFTYNANGTIATAADQKSHSLTFNYTGTPSRLYEITDNGSRSVWYRYSTNADTNLDLVSVRDPEGYTNSFAYDTNHQITATYDPLGRMVVSNVWDVLGHVTTQYTQGDINKTWQIFWSGWETVSQDPAGSKTRYFYDDQTRLIRQQDPLGNSSQTVYDGQNHPVMTISPLGEISQAIYDGNHNVIQTIDPLGFTNQYLYDTNNNLVQVIDARGNASKYGYDNHFRLIGSTNGAGDWVVYTYNTDGTIATRVDSGSTNTFAYDAGGTLSKVTYPGTFGSEGFLNNTFGDVLNHTNARGFVTSYKYNNRRELTNSIAPTNVLTRLVYDGIGNTVASTDARGFSATNIWSVTRHLQANILPATTAGTAVVTNLYDNRDWLTKTINPLGQPVLYTNDVAQRLIAIADPLARTITMGYDADGHNLTSTNAAGNVTVQQYDARGSETILTDPALRVLQQAYDGAGNQVILTNRNGKIWQFQFDAANRLTNTVTPLSRASSQAYNNRGLLVSSKDPAGQTQTFVYDGKGRLTSRTDLVGTNLYAYDANDNLTNVIGNGLTNSWTYDAYDHVSSYTDIYKNAVKYKYDPNGNLTNLVYPGTLNVYYAYDSLNHLTNVTDWTGRQTVFTYDLAGRLTSIVRPNGTQRTISYDAAGQTINIVEQQVSGAVINFFKYSWDNAARMQWEYSAPLPATSSLPTRNLTYDNDDRAITIDGNTIVNDLDGNITSGPLTNDTPVAYTYDARNRLLNAGGVTNAYDAMDNRVGQVCSTNTTVYVINPNGKLPQVLMRIKNGATNYYIYGSGLLYQLAQTATRTNTVTYHYDYRGSTVTLTDDNANVTDRIGYSAYATIISRSGVTDTPFLYNGRYGVMTDTNGLLYMQARYYNPYICRFINPDPSGFQGGANFYAYANGDPISNLDPYGLGALGESALTDHWFDAPTEQETEIQNGLADFANLVTLGTADFASSAINGTDLKGNPLDFGDAFQNELESGAFLASLALALPTDGGSLEADYALVGEKPLIKSAGQLGREGETLASDITGVGKNKQSWVVNGRTRIPDQVVAQDIFTRKPTIITEVKNVKSQSLTQQLRDYADLVGPGGRVNVALPPGAKVTGPLQKAFNNPASPLKRIDLVAPKP